MALNSVNFLFLAPPEITENNPVRLPRRAIPASKVSISNQHRSQLQSFRYQVDKKFPFK